MPCLLAAGGMLAKKKTAGIVSDDLRSVVHNGGDEGDRTPDLLNAIQALSQLSYAPVWYLKIITQAVTNFKPFFAFY